MSELNARGGGVRESGAFLLGRVQGGRREILGAAYYDDLDPTALDTGIVTFRGTAFGRLWDICEQRSQEVVADVHTHPGAPWQSGADAVHPMIARPEHVSLIVPCFAQFEVGPSALGIYEYLGEHRWRDHSGHAGLAFFYMGWLG